METLHLAKYPFLRDAAEHVKDRGVTLEDLLGHEAFRQARTRGKARVVDALEDGVVHFRPMGSEEEQLEEITLLSHGQDVRFLRRRQVPHQALCPC